MDLWPGSHLLSRHHRHHHITPSASSSEGGHNSDYSPIPIKTVDLQKFQILLFASDLLHRGVANPVDMYKTRVSAMLCGRHVAATESTHNGSDTATSTEEMSSSNSSSRISESIKGVTDANHTSSVSDTNGSKDSKEGQGKVKTAITMRGTSICMYIH